MAKRFTELREAHGSDALAGFGSAKCSNEEAYLFQKMVRAVFGTNNVDHCTRLCHASSVAALLETIGSGAVTTIYRDIENSDVALVTGTNTTSNHPVAATFFKEAAANGTKIIVVDPRRPDLADHAHEYVRIRSGSDVSFYNAVMHVILEEGLQDERYIAEFTENFDALREVVARYPPEVAAPICGVGPETIRRVAKTIGSAQAMLVYWGMGISQHVHGTDNARSLINLVLMTGNCGRPGTGLHPLRGQNNVQGASDAGLIPMVYPDYQPVADDAVREKFEAAWGVSLDPNPGKTVVEIAHAAEEGTLHGLYVMGENPFLSDPNVGRAREAFCALDFLVVQDIFLTETGGGRGRRAAGVELLREDRHVHEHRPSRAAGPDRGRHAGRGPSRLADPVRRHEPHGLRAELRRRRAGVRGVQRADGFVQRAALRAPRRPRQAVAVPRPREHRGHGRAVRRRLPPPRVVGGRFAPAEVIPPAELPDEDYPMVLNTGRMLQHWHTGSMTRRSMALDAIAPRAVCEVHPDDLASIGVEPGGMVRVSSRRGSIRLRADATTKTAPGDGVRAVPLPRGRPRTCSRTTCWTRQARSPSSSSALFGSSPRSASAVGTGNAIDGGG